MKTMLSMPRMISINARIRSWTYDSGGRERGGKLRKQQLFLRSVVADIFSRKAHVKTRMDYVSPQTAPSSVRGLKKSRMNVADAGVTRGEPSDGASGSVS